jgi:hypothetical protein
MYECVGVELEVEVVFLHVLAVIALVTRQTEEAFLENRIAAVPQRQGEAEVLRCVADAAQTVLVPAVDARARVVVREIVPGGALGAVVFAHRAPGALAEIGPPILPGGAVLPEPVAFDAHRRAGIGARMRSRKVKVRLPGSRGFTRNCTEPDGSIPRNPCKSLIFSFAYSAAGGCGSMGRMIWVPV